MSNHPSCEEILYDAQAKPPLVYLTTMSSCPVPACIGEEADPHLTPFRWFWTVIRFPLSLLFSIINNCSSLSHSSTGHVLQTLPQLHCPPLDAVQPLNVLLEVRDPELNMALKRSLFLHYVSTTPDNGSLLSQAAFLTPQQNGRSYSSIKFKPDQEEIKAEREWKENKAFFTRSCLVMAANNSNAAMILKDW
ncbi:uncharacterized protein M8220_010396 [Acridotheres tristis]